jgi:two-component system, LytTR family, sensor kinase
VTIATRACPIHWALQGRCNNLVKLSEDTSIVPLQMKTRCERCGSFIAGGADAYICSYECTFCPACADDTKKACPHCAGELVQRPRRNARMEPEVAVGSEPVKIRPGTVWTVSMGIWIFVSAAATITIYQMYRLTRDGASLGMVAGMEFSQIMAYAPLTPFVFYLAVRYPVRGGNWVKQSLLYAAAGLVFTVGHITIRGFTPYGYWDSTHRHWASAFWDSSTHSFTYSWLVVRSMFLASVVDDVCATYIPIVVIAHALLYYRRLQEKELRAAQLAAQLTKARLQTLKSQMQPHFLFNTLHSISSLMLTNVVAADRMMTSLSDLLRMSLEDNGNQLTTLSRELEFLSVYVEIEKARFEDRLHVVFDIAPECLDTQVPHLLLQPLVENAVRHGISKRSQPGRIFVLVRRGSDNLEVWIRDNGPGLVDPPEQAFKRGLGLSVARERLRELYGERQTCTIRNMPHGGAEVYLRMPFNAAVSALKSEAAAHRYL